MNKTILAAVVLMVAAFAGVMIVGDDTDAAESNLIEVEDVGGGDVKISNSIITGIVKNKDPYDPSTDPVYQIKLTIKSGMDTYVTYLDETIKSVAANAQGKVEIPINVDKDTESFVYAITASAQTSMVGLATSEIFINVDFNDGAPSDITWKADGITIATISTDAPEVPAAPSKAHYTFMGWAIDGTVVITYNAGLPGDGYVLAEAFVTETITTPDQYLAAITEDTVIEASFTPVIYTVTLKAGEETVGTITAPYGTTIVEPRLPEGFKAWDFDFSTPITGDIAIVAIVADPIAPVTVYDVTFEIEGKAPVVQKSDSLVVPDTTREGYAFQGWVVKGGAEYVDPTTYAITADITFVAVYKTSTETTYTVTFEIEGKASVTQKADSLAIPDVTREGFNFQGWVVKGGSSAYVDPLSYEITADVTFVAVYKAKEVIEHTVTFVNGETVIDTVKVVDGTKMTKPAEPEGFFWLFDFETVITADTTIEAKPLTVTVQFAVGEKVYNAYTQVIAYGEKIDVTKLTDFIFPDGYDSWNYDFNEPVTADMTVYAKAIPEPEKEPKFYETPMGQCAIIIAVFIVGLVFFGVFTGRIELPKFKVSRVSKDEVVEQIQEEKKP